MEDLVAVEVTTRDGGRCWFITWGRIQDETDPAPIERLILSIADHWGIPGEPVSARLCGSLREAADAPWFYEALFEFSQKTIPYGTDYTKWRKRMAKRMKAYREAYFAGPSRSTDAGRQPKPAT